MTSCSTCGIIVTNIAYEYGCPGSNPRLDNFFFRFLRFFVQFFFNARNILSIIPSTAGKIVYPVPALYNLPFLFIKIDRVILTQVGFRVISPWSLSRFLSNHRKALLRWLLHLHINFQLILPRRLPCRRDRPSTLFYANNRS